MLFLGVVGIGLVAFAIFAFGFKAGAAHAKTYTCQKCGEYDAEQARIEDDEERFARDERYQGLR